MTAPHRRPLVVTADDFGVGPETTRGILDLARQGLVTGTVMLTNSPHAESAVRAWRKAGEPVELGWHPCLTIDAPILPPGKVGSLVEADGCFPPLGRFLLRLVRGLVRPGEMRAELAAQLGRFRELVGSEPTLVNAHHHIHVFPPVGAALREVLAGCRPRPFLRRVRETGRLLTAVPGARAKRALLTAFGDWQARLQRRAGFPGADTLLGITDPPCVTDPLFWERWLREAPPGPAELACHPGHLDPTLLGRDASPTDGQMERRVREFELLDRPHFRAALDRHGFELVPPSALNESRLPLSARAKPQAA
jgi:predicted glycoside hydrolase/deacetylase ChbG (UPF0249 family)